MLVTKDVVVQFFRHQWRLTKTFFSANDGDLGKCIYCGKFPLRKDERVDIEFFGGDLESLCIKHWIMAFERKEEDVKSYHASFS